ncbi:MAG: hypothetical protein NZ895_02360 [Archaeoglobaceae archaeon]|nr:hypothetical protein [Archaeoglobaceae archaeon]MCX8152199.1 hypothetical protein [Archaeoglobaceae archaeon]MDW8013915.1 hypothetical protein [Archaeoglobaceae archaeon]
MEEEVVNLIKKIIEERGKRELKLLDIQKASAIAVEKGLDASCVRQVIEEINKMLENKFKSKITQML